MQHRLVWFRDDLRVNDNAALSAALDCQSDVVISAVFLTADSDWKDFHYGRNRLYYTEQLLRSLSAQLAALGINLEVVRLDSYRAQVAWVADYCESRSVTDLFLNQEYQWNERIRDHQILERLPDVAVHTYVDRVLLQPGTVLTGDNRYYSVFSPFKRRWLSIYQERATGPFDVDGRSRESVKPSTWDPICSRPDSDLSFSDKPRPMLMRHLMNSSLSGLKTTKRTATTPRYSEPVVCRVPLLGDCCRLDSACGLLRKMRLTCPYGNSPITRFRGLTN